MKRVITFFLIMIEVMPLKSRIVKQYFNDQSNTLFVSLLSVPFNFANSCSKWTMQNNEYHLARSLLDKGRIAKLVDKIPTHYWNRWFIAAFTGDRYWFWAWANWIHSESSCWWPILILLYHYACSSSGPARFSDHNFVHISHIYHAFSIPQRV